MHYILMAIWVVGTGGYSNGYAISYQDFYSKKSCEAAIVMAKSMMGRSPESIKFACVSK